MDWTYIHLVTNHLPVLGAVFGFVFLAWGILRSSVDIKTVGLGVLVFTALMAIPVYLTGEPAEETAEALPGVTDLIIDRHEDFAIFALISAIVSGVVALIGLVIMRSSSSLKGIAGLVIVVISGITVGTMGWTAKLGGEIRHTEIRAGAQTSGPTIDQPKKNKAGDDDD